MQGMGAAVDIRTVMLMMAVGYFAFGMILLAYRSSGGHRRMLDVWTAVQFVKSAATLLVALRGVVPDMLSVIGGNGLTFLGFSLELLVFRYYVFHRWHLRFVGWIGGTLLAVLLIDTLLLAPAPTAGHAALIVSCGLALLTLLNGLALLQAKPPRSALLYTLAVGNLLMAVTAALRVYTLLAVEGIAAFSPLPSNQMMFHVAYLLMLLNGFGFLLLVKQGSDEELRRLSATDGLTGLSNRRAFTTLAQHMQRSSRRTGSTNSLILLDLDHFKHVNDTYGHAAGDAMLKAVAARIRNVMRDPDVCARLGGEEFAVVLPDASVDDAIKAAERLRDAIAGIRIDAYREDAPLVTMSAGVTELRTDETLGNALARADAALYAAKRAGRNRVVHAPG